MQCTINKVMSDENSGLFCDQWRSKHKYNELAIGGDTKFDLLYVDFKIFGDRFDNELVEGGVRPPNLLQAGFRTGGGVSPSIYLSIQWDSAFYTKFEVIASSTYSIISPAMSDKSIIFSPYSSINMHLSVHAYLELISKPISVT